MDTVEKHPRILVVDDEESMCNFMEIMLKKEGYQVYATSSAKEAVVRINNEPPDLIIADIMMPEMSGIELLTSTRKKNRDIPFILMTAFASVDSAVDAFKQGAADYITKPFRVDEIRHVIRKIFDGLHMATENAKLKNRLHEIITLDDFIGNSDVVIELKELVRKVALSDATVLILGESGTGKDLIARSIHYHSRRREKPFVAINCGAIPELLLESELFGHKKGSFTGAIQDKDGLFKTADTGVLFLDEIGNLSLTLQVKLLRVLETQEFTPVGSTRPERVDVRLIAATNSNLEEEVKANHFRADLFYRLNVLPINLPSLSERREDIPLLANYFLYKIARKNDSEPKSLSEEAERLISSYGWSGNVRELENTITRAFLLCKGETIESKDFPKQIRETAPAEVVTHDDPVNPTLESIEKAYIFWVLKQTGGNKSKTARILGIDTSTLYRKISRYNLDLDES